MKKLGLLGGLALVALFAVVGSTAVASHRDNGDAGFRATLSGFEEVPSVSTTGSGTFRATLVNSNRIDYTLTFSGLEGNAQAAHIHFAQRSVNGNVVAFLCGGGGKPSCGNSTSGTITGSIAASDIASSTELTAQGIAAGEFAEVLRAMRAGVTYANVHSTKFPGGEIRGQIFGGGRQDNGKGEHGKQGKNGNHDEDEDEDDDDDD